MSRIILNPTPAMTSESSVVDVSTSEQSVVLFTLPLPDDATQPRFVYAELPNTINGTVTSLKIGAHVLALAPDDTRTRFCPVASDAGPVEGAKVTIIPRSCSTCC